MNAFEIAGIGEILWDVLEKSEELGGAPMNFAYHAGALGANGHAISTVGNDARGDKALKELQQRGVSCEHISVQKGGVTGYVLAQVDSNGVASYQFPDNVAWDAITVHAKTLDLAPKLDAVCFGSLAQRAESSRQVIHDFLSRVGEDTLKVFDMNIRQHFYSREVLSESMRVADVVKLNDEELELIAGMEHLFGNTQSNLQALLATYNLKLIVLTRGNNGSLLIRPGEISDHDGFSTKVVDTIGAGDSFTAATVLGMLQGMPLDTMNDWANRVAAYVCSQKGAMPKLSPELISYQI